MKRHTIYILLLIVLASCTQRSIVNESMPIDGDLWNAKDTKSIDFEVKDTLNGYNFYLLVKNNNDYPYRNLFVFVNLEMPGNRVSRDTVLCELANTEGRWLGTGVGGTYSNELLYKRNQKFPTTGDYRITIEHAMRDQDVEGITNVGISIRKNK